MQRVLWPFFSLSPCLIACGQEVVVGGEGLLSGESLFRPSVVGLSGCGITDLLVQSLSDAAAAVGTGGQESERVKSLFESVALVGGVSTMPGTHPFNAS